MLQIRGEESPGSKKKAHLLPDSEDEAEGTNEVVDEVHERRTADSQEGKAAATLSAQEGSSAGSKGQRAKGTTGPGGRSWFTRWYSPHQPGR